MNNKQIFHPYYKWEEYKAGMWKRIHGEKRNQLLLKAIKFMGNHKLYGSYMIKVLKLWPFSCEHNLSYKNLNRQAWIGHAACCIAIGCPEDITREAWHFLLKKQRDAANKEADKAIQKWEKKQMKTKKIKQLSLF